MSMTGADSGQLEEAAAQLRTAAEELDQYSTGLSSLLGSVSWIGEVASGFLGDWSGVHRVRMNSTAEFIRDMAITLDANATDQRATSESNGTRGPGGGTGPGDGDGGGGGDDPDGFWSNIFGDVGDLIGDIVGSVGPILGGVGGFVDDLSRLARGLRGVGGVLSGLQVFQGGFELAEGILEGDGWLAADGLINVGLGAAGIFAAVGLVSNPVGWAILGAGAVWAVGNWLAGDQPVTEWAWNGITSLAEGAWDGVTAAGGFIADTASNVTDAVGDFAGDVASGAADAAGDVVDFVSKF